jgi:WD40 repeat protein
MPYYVMQFIQGLGLDEVLEELKRLRNVGQAASLSLEKRQVENLPHGQLSAAHMARSLLTGAFERTIDHPNDMEERGAPSVLGPQPEQAADTPRSSLVSDSFTLSSSSVVLPGRSRDGSKSKGRKQTYWQSVASIGVQVADALEYAHKQGVQHRDIKPSNLLLDTQGTVWVTDFGLAKADDQPNLTHTGDILGTLRYMPPEAFEGKTDARGDVYSLGLTLYEMLALRPAFAESDRHRLIKQVMHQEPARLGKLNRQVPRDLETIVHKAIDKDPNQRYTSAGALAEDLQRFIEDEPIKARRVSVSERAWRWCRHNPALAGLMGAVAMLLVGVAAVSTASNVRITAARDTAIQAQAREGKQRQRAEDSADESRQQLVLAQVAGGAVLVEQGDLHGALSWFAEALRLDQGDPAQEENHRLRLAATLQRSPKLVALWSGQVGPGRAVFCPDGGRVAVSGPSGLRFWDVANGQLCLVVAKDSAVTDFAFSPDGSWVATAGQDGAARVWDQDTGRPVTPPLRHSGPVQQVAFSPEGGRLATASDDKTARLWDAATGKQLQSWPQGEAVQSISFSPDGKRVVTRSGGMVRVWEAASGKRVTEFYQDMGTSVHQVAFSADGRGILVTGNHRIVRTWDPDTGRLLTQIPRPGRAWLSPDHSRAVSGWDDRPAQVWDVRTGQPLTPPLELARGTTEASFSLQGDRIVTTRGDGTVRVWDIETGKVVAGPLRHGSPIESATFSPDGRRLVSRDSAGQVRVWDLAGTVAPTSPLQPALEAFYWWFSPDGRWVVIGTPMPGNANIWLWDARTGRPGKTVLLDGWVHSAVLSPDGSRLLTGDNNGVARIWQAATGQPISEPLRHGNWVSHVEFSPDGRLATTAGQDRMARVWDAATGQRIAEVKHEHAVRWAAFSPDGGRLVTATGDVADSDPDRAEEDLLEPKSDPRRLGEAQVWEVAAGRPLTPPIRHEGVVQRASFSPDGRFILTTCVSRAADRSQVQVWDAATGQAVTTPLVHPQMVRHEIFSPDGRHVATGCGDGAARVWDIAPGKALRVLAKDSGPVFHVSFSADARRLLTASGDGTARVWDVATGQPIAVLRHARSVRHAVFAADGYSVITGCVGGEVRVWPLAPDHRPVDDWVAVAELMAGGATDASKDRGHEEDMSATWPSLRAKYPGDFATTKPEQLAWHRAALEIAARKKDWPAALAHLGRLLDLDPADCQSRLARARLLARLERWDEAEAEFTRTVERHPDLPQVWVARGSFCLARGQRDRAEADFVQAIHRQGSREVPASSVSSGLLDFIPKTLVPPSRRRSNRIRRDLSHGGPARKRTYLF